MPKTNLPDGPRYGTCRLCRCSIINQGKGWYHTPERPTVPYPGHYAAPMTRAVA